MKTTKTIKLGLFKNLDLTPQKTIKTHQVSFLKPRFFNLKKSKGVNHEIAYKPCSWTRDNVSQESI